MKPIKKHASEQAGADNKSLPKHYKPDWPLFILSTLVQSTLLIFSLLGLV